MWFFVAPCHTAGYAYRLVFPVEKNNAVRWLSWEIKTSTSEKNEGSHFQCFETVGFRKSGLNALPESSRLDHRISVTDRFENISVKDHAIPSENERQENGIGPVRTRGSLKLDTGSK
ncbi:hypothetical protein CCUS01_04687 [Colletotrichum cuscutae]|uniref:Uncharacterized protein n=1 Tax=Colletotrichum cuscutae TaxID=1209917 RepID=A0AAI9VAY2_9PEZI|nr:hypothetical protein CCUS01_04687 [Colletotrichum cuscutae]